MPFQKWNSAWLLDKWKSIDSLCLTCICSSSLLLIILTSDSFYFRVKEWIKDQIPKLIISEWREIIHCIKSISTNYIDLRKKYITYYFCSRLMSTELRVNEQWCFFCKYYHNKSWVLPKLICLCILITDNDA